MGREDEVRDLFDDHYDQVVRTAFLIVQDWGRAEEVAQESFLRIIQSASRYRANASFRNYLYRIARNLCVVISGFNGPAILPGM